MRQKIYLSLLCCLSFLPMIKAQTGESFKDYTKDGAWCWFSDPRAIYHQGKTESMYVGWVDHEGNIIVSSHNLKTGAQKNTIVSAKFQHDDHCDPSLLFLPDGRLMVFFTHHNGGMYYTTSLKPEDVSKFEDVHFLDYGKQLCYTNPVMLSEENNRIYVFMRGGHNWKPSYMFSDDLGKTWSQAVTVVEKPEESNNNRPYTKVVSDGKGTIFLAFTDGHPRDEPTNSIYLIKYHAGQFTDVAGNFLSNKDSLPINQHVVPRAYDGTKTKCRAWIWDVAINKEGNPAIVYTLLPEETMHKYAYAEWNGTEWKSYTISAGGKDFPRPILNKSERNPEPHYSGGIILDHSNTHVVYLSKPVGDVFEIFKYVLADDGTWSNTQITFNSKQDNVRPYVLRQRPDDMDPVLFWMNNNMYEHYRKYNTSIKVLGLKK